MSKEMIKSLENLSVNGWTEFQGHLEKYGVYLIQMANLVEKEIIEYEKTGGNSFENGSTEVLKIMKSCKESLEDLVEYLEDQL